MKPVFCLFGPTASGKTDAALAIAQRFPVEIISMDSALVYLEMDIGTAKPSLIERAQTRHHLIDILDPTESYSAAHFRKQALALIEQIIERHHIPLIVGGTMLYFKALSQGLSALPNANPEVRAELNQLAQQHGWKYLYARLKAVDPISAQRISTYDTQRIQRALEVYTLTKQPLSTLIAQSTQQQAPYLFEMISLEPTERAILHQRIALRFDQMLEKGFLEEAKALFHRGDLTADLPSMRCVGYRQAWEYLSHTIDFASFREKSIFATRQLCKRQLTWLRALEKRQVIDTGHVDRTLHAVDCFTQLYNAHRHSSHSG